VRRRRETTDCKLRWQDSWHNAVFSSWPGTHTEAQTYMNATKYRARPLAELPFYCHPLYLFLTVWAVMLGSLEVQVSESTYPGRSMGFILFFVSLLSLLAGVGTVRLANYGKTESPITLAYRIDSTRLWRINWILFICIVPIFVFNCLSFGAPPALGFFGVSTVVYIEYGRFKQVLFPLAMALFVNSSFEESRVRRWFWRFSSLGILLAYVARGPILMAVAQSLVLYSIRTSVSKRKIYVRAIIVLLMALVAMDVIGDNRTSKDVFFSYLEIKNDFRDWPMAILWPVAYFSIPISNMCWIVKNAHFHAPTFSFLYQLLPAFWWPTSPHQAALSDPHLIDGVHTYLANYFLDFSWAGIVGCNFAIGLVAGFLTCRERISRKFMSSPVVLSGIGFIFFWDFFTTLSTVLEFSVQMVIEKRCIVPIRGVGKAEPNGR
jgi:oligosaccharide repeat unit polymerase